jgi:hypothetical protein
MRVLKVASAALLAAAATACGPVQKASRGFHMPNGDPARGRQALVELRCTACHTVYGADDLPAPVADPPVPVRLGGVVTQAKTDGQLAASILDPSHHIRSGDSGGPVRSQGLSRMGDFSEAMTTRQLIDIVAYLHTRYEVLDPPVL